MNIGWRNFFTLLTVMGTLQLGCASHLKREKKIAKPTQALKVDLRKLKFTELDSGKTISVHEFMERNDKQFVLLIFGSVGCGVCNQKAKQLALNYWQSHPLLLNAQEKKFALVGVNTDSGSTKRRFQSIYLNGEQRSRYGYDFVQWADESGKTLSKYLLAKNKRFGVPFTVMLNRRGILWRYHNDEAYTFDALFKRAENSIAGKADRDFSTPEKDPEVTKPEDEKLPEINLPDVFFANRSRFGKTNIQNCGGQTQNLKTILNSNAQKVFLQITNDECAAGSTCAENREQFAEISPICSSCQFMTLALATPSADSCVKGNIAQGGESFYQAFATHFNWAYDPEVDEYDAPIAIQPLKGPLVLGFSMPDLNLIYSYEGKLPAKEDGRSITHALAQNTATLHAQIAYGVFDGNADKPFGEILHSHKYTVLNSFDRSCGSCLEELADWRKSLGKYCAEEVEENFCQIYALEAELAFPNNAAGRTKFYNTIRKDFFAPLNIDFPLLLETDEFGDGYGRFFASYLTPLFPNWDSVYGTVIYDHEGKIVANFKSLGVQSPDPVHLMLKALHAKQKAEE